MKRMKGVVSSMGIRYGFIMGDNKKSYFVSRHQIIGDAVFQGDRVTFIPSAKTDRKNNSRRKTSLCAIEVMHVEAELRWKLKQ